MKKASFLNRVFGVQTKGLADPLPDLWALFGVTPTATGVTISVEQALSYPAVSSAIRLISEAAASLEWAVQEQNAAGEWVEVEDDPASEFLCEAANDWTSGYEFLRDLLIDALSDDVGGLGFVNRVNGRIIELIRYRSGMINVLYEQATGEPKYIRDGFELDPRDVIHLRAPFHKSPLTLAREAIATGVLLSDHASRLFANGSRPAGALKFPKGMGEASVTAARASWMSTHAGAANAGKTAILYDGAEYQQFAFSSTDSEFIANRKFQILEVCRVFRVPPSMLHDLDRATWSNTEQMGDEFLIYCLEPWLKVMEGALTRGLIDRGVKRRVRCERDDMTRADLVTRATAISSLISSKTISPNEGREWLGMEPYDGGDEFANPHINPTAAVAALPAPAAAQPDQGAADV